MRVWIGFVSSCMLWAAPETIDRSFTGVKTVEIRGISGFIKVTGVDGDRADFHVDQRTDDEDVKLVFTESAGTVRAVVEKPDGNWKGSRRVEHDFTVRVPRGVRLLVRNVNGEITVDGVSGECELKTVNGPIRAKYAENPRTGAKFETINGKIELWLRPNLNADFEMKTLNGKIYSDFEMTSRPITAEAGKQSGTKWVYRSDRKAATRVGQGGPLLAISGLNSEILIHSTGK